MVSDDELRTRPLDPCVALNPKGPRAWVLLLVKIRPVLIAAMSLAFRKM